MLRLFFIGFLFAHSPASANESSPVVVAVAKDQSAEICDLDGLMAGMKLAVDQERTLFNSLSDLQKGKGAAELVFPIDITDQKAVEKELEKLTNTTPKEWSREYWDPDNCVDWFNNAEMDQLLRDLKTLSENTRLQLIGYYKKDFEDRKKLVDLNRNSESLEEESAEAEKDLAKSQEAREEAKRRSVEAAKSVKDARTEEERNFAAQMLKIEKVREELAENVATWSERVTELIRAVEVQNDKLNSLAGALNDQLDQSLLIANYQETISMWRRAIEDSNRLFSGDESESELPPLPPYPKEFLGKIAKTELVEQYAQSYESAKHDRQAILQKRSDRLEKNFDVYYQLIDLSSAVRVSYLDELSRRNILTIEVTPDYFEDILREIFIIPTRLTGIVFTRYVAIKSSLTEGASGIYLVVKDTLWFLLLCFVPFGVIIGFRKASAKIESFRKDLWRNKSLKWGREVSGWIQRLTPYLPWVACWATIAIIDVGLSGTLFDEFRILLPVAKYYTFYRAFRLVLMDVAFSIRRRTHIKLPGFKELVESTGRLVGLFFLVSTSFLYLTEFCVGRSIVYGYIDTLVTFFGIFVCALACYKWRELIIPAARETLSEKVINKTEILLRGRLVFLVCLPLLVLLVFVELIETCIDLLEKWDLTKKIFTKIYRKKLEAANADAVSSEESRIPKEYAANFTYMPKLTDEFLVDSNEDVLKQVHQELSGWLMEDEEDQSIAIYGEKGVGKTIMLDRIHAGLKNMEVIRLSIPPKLTSKKQLWEFLKQELELPEEETLLKTISAYSKSRSGPQVIMVDEAHNLFVSKVGGFDALNAFIDVVNLKTENLFWVAAFNEFAWAYLKGVLGNAQYFRNEFKLHSWSDEEIADLIMKRHDQTQYQLSYDRIAKISRGAANFEDMEDKVEEQFFRILWEQANGNPRVALYLWLNCLNRKNRTTFEIGLPERARTQNMQRLNDDAWFILAAIARHDTLTRKEASWSTDLPIPVVSHTLKVCVESDLVHREHGGRYMLDFSYQFDILRQLKLKNFIYGID